jgi:hypothetical protein
MINVFKTSKTVSPGIDEFLSMIDLNPDLQTVRAHKQRFGYMVNDSLCAASTYCNLERNENLNYLQVIKRIIGWINKPLAN